MYIKISFVCMCLLMNIYTAFAQVALTESCNKPIIGDKVKRQLVDGICCDGCGDDIVWDFSGCTIKDETFPIRFSMDSSSFKSSEPGLRKYYIQSGDTLLVRGYQSSYVNMNYTVPLIEITYPFNHGDSISSLFSGRGKYCNSYNISHNGTRIVMADAKGSILLPNNMILKDVERIHKITLNNILIEGLEQNLVDTATTKQEMVEEYYWYVKHCRYPIFEYRKSSSYNKGTVIGSQTESYCYLPDSVINKAISYADYILNKNQHSRQTEKLSENSDNAIDYKLSQTGNIIQLSYSTTVNTKVTFIIAGITGIIYLNNTKSCKPGERYSITFDCNGFRPGEYIIYINLNGIVNSETIQIK